LRWNAEEAAAAIFACCAAAGFATGWLPLQAWFQWWLVASRVWIVNQVRTLAAHGYVHGDEPVDAEGQLLDSINLRGWPWLTGLLAPVGLRFHALHHYLPALPYHSLGSVHRELLWELPADAAYRQTLRGGLWETLQALFRNAPGSVGAQR
jgi:fatty acid desaturase